MQIYDASTYNQEMIYLGMAGNSREDGAFFLEQKNKFCVGDRIEIMKPGKENVPAVVETIQDEEGAFQNSAPHARQRLWVKLSEAPEPYDILRVEKNHMDVEKR